MWYDIQTEIIAHAFSIVSSGICFMMALFSYSARHTLMGSFFKKYYNLMIFSFVVIGMGLLVDGARGLVGLDADISSLIHHALLLIGIIAAMGAGMGLPNEIAKQFNGKIKSKLHK